MTTKLDNLFERILSETDTDNGTPAERAALHAAITRTQKTAAPDGDATERLAAYLDGTLDDQDTERFAESLADAPDELYELEAAQSFLGEMAARAESAPADLVAAASASVSRAAPRRAARRSWFLSSASWGRQFAWAGGAAATVVLAIVIFDRAGEIIGGTTPTVEASAPALANLRAYEQLAKRFEGARQGQLLSAVPESQQQPQQMPPSGEARPRQQTQQAPARIDGLSRDRRNERETSQLTDAGRTSSAGQPATSSGPSAPQPRQEADQRALATIAPAPPPPPAPVAKVAETPETVAITGSLIRGTAAAGVPVTNLSPQDFAAAPAPAPMAQRLAQSQAQDSFRYQVAPAAPPSAYPYAQNAERYPGARPNPVKLVANEPVSTFSLDVDTASYANVRRYLNQNVLPPVDAVRVEEMVNYFDYAYMMPRDRDAPFAPSVVVYPSPWNPDTQILHVGIKGYDIPRSERPKANLVFLIDTSGSMNSPDKLPLVKRSFQMLVEQLKPEDRVSIVVYAGSAGMVLEPTPGWDKDRILASLDRLQAGGSTAGGEGIRQAYDLAKLNFDRNGVNRVILATDGDFNVGITDPNALEAFVARERTSGVFLSVLGYGGGNYNDLLMQKLAQAGNGAAAYIDTANEARKVLVDEMSSTLFTIAKDVKVQVEFNPARVAEYRLIGYETRMLNQTDFNNDKVDAGDVGAGHTVTALYEITPVGSRAQTVDPLRYGGRAEPSAPQSEIAFVKIRYKLPNEDESKLITRPVANADVVSDFNRLPIDYRFAAAVAGGAQLLKHDPSIKSFDYGRAIEIAQSARGDDEFGYRNEFVQLLRTAQSAAGLQDLGRSLPRSRE
jgi:Ca-activated chloride channel family protein